MTNLHLNFQQKHHQLQYLHNINDFENKKGLNKDRKVFVDKKTMHTYMDDKYEEIKGTVNLKGFRPGKVPREVLKRQFGKAVFNEVLDKVIKDTSTKA